MKKFDVDKWLIYILIGLIIFICADKLLQGFLSYFYGEGKKYTTDASKETIREYTHIITSSVSFLIGYFVKGKIDKAEFVKNRYQVEKKGRG